MDEYFGASPRVNRIIRGCGARVGHARARHGDPDALIALACGSLLLQSHIADGLMTGEALLRLGQYADNVGLNQRLGHRAVRIALNQGPWFFDELAGDWPWQQRTVPREAEDA
jgi:hypothetical protein